MKTIDQLIELKKNPYYQFTVEEQKAYDAFLSGSSEQNPLPKNSSKDTDKKIPATVRAKNVVETEKNLIPNEKKERPTVKAVSAATNAARQKPKATSDTPPVSL